MTRNTPSQTKRELERLRRKRNGDADDGPGEVAVEIEGVAAAGPDEDAPPCDRDDRPAVELFRVDLETGETVETPGRPDPDDLDECSTADCPNPVHPVTGGVCESCDGMPAREWRPVVRENEADGDAHE